MPNRTKLFTTLLIAAALAVPGVASAATKWQNHHPARTAINHRLANQQHRITAERREGEITRGQALAMRSDDHAIRAQERADARADGNHGHLNHAQVRQLNGELNANSRAIGK